MLIIKELFLNFEAITIMICVIFLVKQKSLNTILNGMLELIF